VVDHPRLEAIDRRRTGRHGRQQLRGLPPPEGLLGSLAQLPDDRRGRPRPSGRGGPPRYATVRRQRGTPPRSWAASGAQVRTGPGRRGLTVPPHGRAAPLPSGLAGGRACRTGPAAARPPVVAARPGLPRCPEGHPRSSSATASAPGRGGPAVRPPPRGLRLPLATRRGPHALLAVGAGAAQHQQDGLAVLEPRTFTDRPSAHTYTTAPSSSRPCFHAS
jgi:hypothetical protein